MESIDGTTQSNSCKEGSLWKMKKGITGSNYWKRNWVHLDYEHLYQWQTNNKPRGEAPKYTVRLVDCTIEESQLRKFAFKITDKATQKAMVFAADDFNSYESWLKMLFSSIAYSESSEQQKDDEKSDSSDYSEEFKQFTTDKISDYFFEHDISKDLLNPCVTQRDLRKLLHSLDASLNCTITVNLIIHDLNSQLGDSVPLSAFKRWWERHHTELSRESAYNISLSNPATAADANFAVSLLFGGHRSLFNGVSAKDEKRTEFLYRAKVPRHAAFEHLEPTITDENVADWNERRQALREQASLTQNWAVGKNDDAGFDDVWSNYRVAANEVQEKVALPPLPDAEPSELGELEVHVSKFSMEDAVRACVDLAAFEGVFSKVALEGAKLLVDEYSLPESLKTVRRIALGDAEQSVAAIGREAPFLQEAEEKLYEYGGLLFRIAAATATEADRAPVATRARYIATVDDTLHKMAGREQLAGSTFQDAVEALHTDYQTRSHWSSMCNKKEKFRHLLHPCIGLSTVVDYGGFRLQVLSPLHIMEQFSLQHGYAGVDAAQLNLKESTETETSDDPIFVNCLPAYRSLLQQVAVRLNMRMTRRLLSVASTSLFDCDNVATAHVEILSNRLQAHKGTDNRLYILNFENLLPLDLPRDSTLDHLVRSLRPEFVQKYRAPLSADVLLDPVDDGEELVDLSVQDLLAATQHLYSTHLPLVARALDSLLELVPYDSYSLTQYLHGEGVNCRHIGILFSLCKTPCVRQVLLTECVARSCKIIFRQVLRTVARKHKAESLVAEHRGRSKHSDFVELMDLANAQRRDAVVDLFNVVLGCGASAECRALTDEFWKGILSQVVFQKFGLNLKEVLQESNHVYSSVLHLPALFAALQYHTNCRFRDASFTHLLAAKHGADAAGGLATVALTSSVFCADDVVLCCVPSCDALKSLSVPGELGRVARSGESFLLNGVAGEAVNAFQLRLSLQTNACQQRLGVGCTAVTSSWQQEAVLADTLYKLALSQFVHKQFAEARHTICQLYIPRFTQYSVVTGRMLTLLMSVEFRCGRFDKVRAYFDAAQSIYSYLLGVDHPLISMHMCALADLYRESNCISQASAMLVLAQGVSRKALGEYHLVTALYESKVGVLYMTQGRFKEATVLLSNCLTVLDGLTTSMSTKLAAALTAETVDCLYALTESFSQCEELDLAIHSGFRCVELCTKNPISAVASVHVSCLLTLSDLFVQKGDLDSAFGLLHEAWTALREPSNAIAHSITCNKGLALASLAGRILELVITSLPMQTRSLVHSVAEEAVHSLSHRDVDQVAAIWGKACSMVCASLWARKPVDVINTVIQGVQELETADQPGVLKQGKKDKGSDATIPFALQAAVISRFVKNPQEFSQMLNSL